MADKSFGVKKIDLLGDGTPTIESPNDLNLNANTVAISTNLSVGNRVSVSSGVVTSISGVVTYYGDGQYLTGISVDPNVVGTSLSISGISTLGVTSVTDLTAQDLDVSGIASVGAAITMYGATGIISATQFYGDGSKLTGIGAATTSNIIAETLTVTGVSTLGDVKIGAGITIDASSGISTFYAASNTLNVNTGTTNAAINIQYGGDTKGSLTPKSDGLEIDSVGDDDVIVHVNSVGGNSGDFIVKSNGSQLLKIDAGDVKSTFSSDVNVGSAITMYQATGIISATKFFGDGSGLTGAGIGADGSVNTTGIITASAFAGFKYLQAPYGSTVTFTVTVAGKDATHRYNGTGSGNGYLINGVQAPILTLTPGRTYRFTNDNTGSHPFKFYYKADKTTEYTTGVNFQNAYTEITISDTTPNVLHYQCTAHPYMGNAVITNSNVVDSPYLATLRDGLSVSGISSVGSAITMYGTSGIISATKFIGDGSSLTGITADTLGDLATLKVTGLSTFNGNMDINADVDISGALSIGGTLTYEDVTNIDSVGLITARSGIAVLGSGVTVTGLSTFYNDLNVGSGITMLSSSGIVSATKFVGDLTGNAATATLATDATSFTVSANNSGGGTVYPVFVDGATGSQGAETDTNLYYNPTSNELTVGSIDANTLTATLDINANGNIIGDNATNISGINSVTATSFFGDGSQLTGISAGGFTPDGQENLYAGTSSGAASDADTCFNIGIGYSALNSVNSGDENIAIGKCAGNNVTSGIYNIFIGKDAGRGNSTNYVTGTRNTVVGGEYAGYSITSGGSNTLLGSRAGLYLTSGSYNTFVGRYAGGQTAVTGANNTALGHCAGKRITSGTCNTALGQNALGGSGNVTGHRNLALGSCAGNTITSGCCNIAIGYDVEVPSATGSDQLAIGSGTNRWITGDSSFNVTLAGIATAYASGIVSATKF